eukprot:g3913.t1
MNEEGNTTEDAIKAHMKKLILEEEEVKNQGEQAAYWNEIFAGQEAENPAKKKQNRRQRDDSSEELRGKEEEDDDDDDDVKNAAKQQQEPEQTSTLSKALRSRKGNYRKQSKQRK